MPSPWQGVWMMVGKYEGRYRGRTGVHELLAMTAELRSLV